MSISTELRHYHIHDNVMEQQTRQYACGLSEQQLDQLDRDGYVVLPSVFDAQHINEMCLAIEEMRIAVDAGLKKNYNPGDVFYRDIMMHCPIFESFLQHELFVGAARAMLGPLVRLRGMTCRDTRTDTGGNQGFGWHIHQRAACDPLPRWFSPPQGLDCLLYLDGLDAGQGCLACIPGSHKDPHFYIEHDHADHSRQQIVELPPGSLVLLHTNCYHRSIPGTDAEARRRLVIASWTPSWYRQSPHDKADRSDWIEKLRQEHGEDPAFMELLGVGGYT